jgi:pectinesterase
MAPPTYISHLLIVVILATVVTVVVTSTEAPSPIAAAPSSAAEVFLRSRCGTTRNSTVCYDTLLPFAGTFNGSQVRIFTAASSIAFAQLHSFLVELQHLQAGGGITVTVISRGDQALGACAHDVGEGVNGETAALPYLRILETPGISKEKAKDALFNVQSSITAAEERSWMCIEDFIDGGDEVLGSPVGKKVVAMSRNCTIYNNIALDLTAGIIL